MLKDNFKKQKLFKFKHIFADGNIIALGLFAEPFPDSAEGVKHIVLDGRYAYFFCFGKSDGVFGFGKFASAEQVVYGNAEIISKFNNTFIINFNFIVFPI